MKKWKVFVVTLVSVVFAGYAAADVLVYDDFESYSDTAALTAVWHGFDEYNPSYVSVLNTTDSHEGSQCLELDSPTMWGEVPGDSDWGIQLGQKEETTDVSGYTAMTVWVMSTAVSTTWDVTFELRDVTGFGTIGYGEIFYLPGDGLWYELTVPLDGEGDKTQLSQVLIWFNRWPPESESGIPQVYVDDIEFIPEPATVAILAVGGLLLRRKK